MRLKFLILGVCVWATLTQVMAVPALPKPVELSQTDGTQLLVYIHGDEFGSYMTTLDGYAIAASNQGGYEYVTFLEDGTSLFSNVLAHNVEVRANSEKVFVSGLSLAKDIVGVIQPKSNALRKAHDDQLVSSKSFPLRGSGRSIVILVNFSDLTYVTPSPQQSFTALLNETGYSTNGGTGSARDYFTASSDSLFQPRFDVCGPYTLSQGYAYYGSNQGGSASEMISEACNLAYAAGIDFAQYDTDNDGSVDNVFVYYAGHNEAEGGGENTIWPHRSMLSDGPVLDGKRVSDYACTSELRGSSGSSMCGIGTFCHEFGHVLGLPDFYNTDNSSAYTVGDWDIMCSGSYNNNGRTPPVYTSFERFSLGWLTPIQLETAGGYVLDPLETSNKAYLIAGTNHNLSATSPSPKEYFLVENRQHLGWDTPSGALPAIGMVAWHINYDAAAWNRNEPNNDPNNLRMELVEAYNINPASSSQSDTYPGSMNVSVFNPILRDGTSLDLPLMNITQSGDIISFVFKGGGDDGFSFFPTSLTQFVSSYDLDLKKVIDWKAEPILISGNQLNPGEDITIQTTGGFTFSIDSMLTWRTSFTTQANLDSNYTQKLYVRYFPTRQNCSSVFGSLKVSTTSFVNMLNLSAQAPRPTYVTTPKVLDPTYVTPYSFFANWEKVNDAELYYLTLYKVEDKRSEIVQSFEKFNDPSIIIEEGWYANFNATTTAVKSLGTRSILFKESQDTLISQRYVSAITELSYWLSATYVASTDVTVGGELVLEAFDGFEWHDVPDGVIKVQRNSKGTQSYKFTIDDNYVQFRLSYTHVGGDNGVAIDAFTAVCDKNIVYLYKNREKSMNAESEPTFYINGLEPNINYFYQLQCTDLDKGCEEHLTALSEPRLVHTLNGEPLASKQLTVVYENGEYVAYVSTSNTKRYIYIYNLTGEKVAQVSITSPVENRVVLPHLYPNTIYLLKYSEPGSMSRKDQWAKFFYQNFP